MRILQTNLLYRKDRVETVLRKTSLVPSAWPAISSSINNLIDLVRQSRFSEKPTLPYPSGLEDCIEIILGMAEESPGLYQSQIVTTRIEEIKHSLEVSSFRNVKMRPIKVFAPMYNPGLIYAEDDVLKIEFYSSSQELDGFLRRSFLDDSCSSPNISLEMSSKGVKENLLLDIHRRFVNLEFIPNQVFNRVLTNTFKGIRLVRQTGKLSYKQVNCQTNN